MAETPWQQGNPHELFRSFSGGKNEKVRKTTGHQLPVDGRNTGGGEGKGTRFPRQDEVAASNSLILRCPRRGREKKKSTTLGKIKPGWGKGQKFCHAGGLWVSKKTLLFTTGPVERN